MNTVWIVSDNTGVIHGVFKDEEKALKCLMDSSGNNNITIYNAIYVYISKASNGVEFKAKLCLVK